MSRVEVQDQVWATLFEVLNELSYYEVARVLGLEVEQARRAKILSREYIQERQRRREEEQLRRAKTIGGPRVEEEELL